MILTMYGLVTRLDDSSVNQPKWTLSNAPVKGSKVDKSRIICLDYCNRSVTERLPLMTIGRSKCPSSFKKTLGQDLGFDYHVNSKAWMARTLFFDWHVRFD